MLTIQFSNRFEVLRDALIEQVGGPAVSPFTAQQIIVPSAAMRRALTLAIADAHGVCVNIDFVYLAQWLWRQIGRVVESVQQESPFAASILSFRIYELLGDPTWCQPYPRLASYLKDADFPRRWDLASTIAAVLERYITYRQDWLQEWAKGRRVALGPESASYDADQDWQAELWRRLVAQMGAEQEHPAYRFFRSLKSLYATGVQPPGLPSAAHVFCLPDIPPLYVQVLIGLEQWMDVRLYVLNPCREYWFEIVDPKRLSQLIVRGSMDHHETGNRLLASWGKQTKGQIELLLDRADHAPLDDSGYREDFPSSLLGRVQRSVFELSEIAPGSIEMQCDDHSIQVHVCHSLTRELEVLQDQLLALFAGPAPPGLGEVLVVTPDVEAAAPLIDAVFGNAPEDRRLPYAVSGRGRSSVNVAARALLSLLAILASRFPSSALLELLQQPIIGRRFGIGSDELINIEGWMRDSGIRWGIDADHRREQGLPPEARFTVEDGLQRLFLGYALPQRVAAPAFSRVPAGGAEGSKALDLGLLAHFFHRLTALRADFRRPKLPGEWAAALAGVLETFLLPEGDELDDLGEVRAAIGELHENMIRGGVTAQVPLPVIRSAFESLLDDPARGGVPMGSITFSSMGSLRNLPFRVICCIGLDDGAFPNTSRPAEFDLMAAHPRRGDRQRHWDDRNVFLDLLLSARERFYVSYTGRSIQDNSVRPASVVVSELLEVLMPAVAKDPTDPASLDEARRKLVIEHPLQPFSTVYFTAGADPRLRSFNRELGEALLRSTQPSEPAATALARETGSQEAGAQVDELADEPGDGAQEERDALLAAPFFASPLAPAGEEWRTVSLAQLISFLQNPCRFLLTSRLGIALGREENPPMDDEPFTAGFLERAALVERLLPYALKGIGGGELESLAEAGIEYPAGPLGAALLREELATLRHFAQTVRDAEQAVSCAALSVDRAFDVGGETWRLSTVLTGVRSTGLVLYRYDDTRPTDYLHGWLTHLVLCAAAPAGVMLRTRWISRNGEYLLDPCGEAVAILESLMHLYRRGLQEPIHFFPKSAWLYHESGGDLGKAREKWRPHRANASGENEHPAYRLAFRGRSDPIDSAFEQCAETVFGRIDAYLRDERLQGGVS